MNAHVKPFAWSYSKLKNFESCPKRHYHVDLIKDFKDDDSEQLLWGNQVHKALAKRLSVGSPLPPGMDGFDKWCRRLLATPGTVLVEQQLAISKDFSPVEWFGKDVWFRSVADVLKIMGPVALAVDWKTGKIVEDSVQLALMAACVFAHYPEVHKIRTEFVWLKDGCSSREDFERTSMATLWRNIWTRVEQLEHAHKTTSYPAKPGFLCRKWCPVSSCPHHGK